jgi:hypothetical protein
VAFKPAKAATDISDLDSRAVFKMIDINNSGNISRQVAL